MSLDNFRHEFYTKNNTKYHKENIIIGKYTYGKPQIISWEEPCKLQIGCYCSIAEDVTIFLGGEHRLDWISTYPFNFLSIEHTHIKGHPATKGDVIIGNDVWIGHGVTILSGVMIGNGAVIGAGSVVTKNVDDYEIVGGNPARHIRYRFSEDYREKLLKTNWWTLSRKKIKKLVPYLLNSQIDDFIEQVNLLKGKRNGD